jgi:quercetin dioxygenase-like cupin family protein
VSNSKIHSAIRSPLLAFLLIATFAGTALATGASGFTSTLLSRGTMSDSVQYNLGAIKFQTKAAVDVATATVTIDPLGSSGWHSHPGIVFVTVKQGTVTFYDQSCAPSVHGAGTVFIEATGDGPGLARNESSSVTAIAYVTYIVPIGVALRISEANPGCPQN